MEPQSIHNISNDTTVVAQVQTSINFKSDKDEFIHVIHYKSSLIQVER